MLPDDLDELAFPRFWTHDMSNQTVNNIYFRVEISGHLLDFFLDVDAINGGKVEEITEIDLKTAIYEEWTSVVDWAEILEDEPLRQLEALKKKKAGLPECVKARLRDEPQLFQEHEFV